MQAPVYRQALAESMAPQLSLASRHLALRTHPDNTHTATSMYVYCVCIYTVHHVFRLWQPEPAAASQRVSLAAGCPCVPSRTRAFTHTLTHTVAAAAVAAA